MDFTITLHRYFNRIVLTCLLLFALETFAQKPVFNSEMIFPYRDNNVHASTIVALPNGDLLAGWFQGNGERRNDDGQILGARKKKGSTTWSEPFILADTKKYPDGNPVLFLDGKSRLWLMWYTVLAHEWESSLLKYKISNDYSKMTGAPIWDWQDNLHVFVGDNAGFGVREDDSFVLSVKKQVEELNANINSAKDEGTNSDRWTKRSNGMIARASGEHMTRSITEGQTERKSVGFPLFRRLGWQTRNKPLITSSGRIIIPLYSDGFNFSLMAITDDLGESWTFSDPLVGDGNVQPSLAQTKSGELVVFMRDNGAAPKRLLVSRSSDKGEKWTLVQDSEIPNPGSGADIVTLKNGNWVLIYNNSERWRNSLVVSLSEDGGKTWPWTRQIELDQEESVYSTTAHYPAIIQGPNGDLHATYSYHHHEKDKPERKTIKYAVFNEAWIRDK